MSPCSGGEGNGRSSIVEVVSLEGLKLKQKIEGCSVLDVAVYEDNTCRMQGESTK